MLSMGFSLNYCSQTCRCGEGITLERGNGRGLRLRVQATLSLSISCFYSGSMSHRNDRRQTGEPEVAQFLLLLVLISSATLLWLDYGYVSLRPL